MGINGLITFVENEQNQIVSNHTLHSSMIIVDGSHLIHKLCGTSSDSNAAFGGDYDLVYSRMDEFCALLDKCNVKPIIVFDGGLDVSNRKYKTRYIRNKNRLANGISCNPNRQVSLVPLFAWHIFPVVCQKHNYQVVQCDFEADDEIAMLSKMLNCPVLSGDSDYIIFGIELIIFNPPSSSFSLINFNGQPAISCKMVYPDRFLKRIGSLPRSHLPLVGILLGNDYIKLQSIQTLVWHGRTKKRTINGYS
jgi:5'-3' exonuclease